MNENIKNLIENIRTDTSGRWVSVTELEKFAESIVWECINTVDKRFMGDLNREDLEVRRCVADLKRHFGVEESTVD